MVMQIYLTRKEYHSITNVIFYAQLLIAAIVGTMYLQNYTAIYFPSIWSCKYMYPSGNSSNNDCRIQCSVEHSSDNTYYYPISLNTSSYVFILPYGSEVKHGGLTRIMSYTSLIIVIENIHVFTSIRTRRVAQLVTTIW